MSEPITYEIKLRGNVGIRLLRPLLDDFTIDRSEPGVTRLVGSICDPSHLHGVVAHVASMNVDIVSLASMVSVQDRRTPGGLGRSNAN